jgi:hypothetical protein
MTKVKKELREKGIKLEYLSLGIVILTTICFLIIIPLHNDFIANLQKEINQLEENRSDKIFNIESNSNQLVKMASTYGSYLVLKALNSSYYEYSEEHLKQEAIQFIVTSKGGEVNKEELEKLSFKELEKKMVESANEAISELSDLERKLRDKENDISNKIILRNILQYVFASFQIIGLLIGFISTVIKKRVEFSNPNS